jgi:nucleoside-diphosphate-sugar epimerase
MVHFSGIQVSGTKGSAQVDSDARQTPKSAVTSTLEGTFQNLGTCVLFGGTGFIGTHFSRFLLEHNLVRDIVLVDIESPGKSLWSDTTTQTLQNERVSYIPMDVCNPLDSAELPKSVDLILNFAATHREPGHEPREYFETNLRGAEHICQWAEEVQCHTIVFTSSISPYGPMEEQKHEQSIPVPTSAYGASKLAAEKIHLAWQRGGDNRRLIIARPGVVFGPGEGGNVTRLIHSVVKGYFFYSGNQQTRKAGGYVKELCNAICWVMQWQQQHQQDVVLFNFTMDPAPSLEEYVTAICKTAKLRRSPLQVPFSLLLGVSYPIAAIAKIFGIKQPIDPVRMYKLVRSNNIVPDFLRSAGYRYRYTLEEAFIDWQWEKPEDWV